MSIVQLQLDKMFPYGSMDIQIFCDGSGGSNNDNGGWGWSAQSKHGNILHEEYGHPDGVSTNNISEYRSVISALKWARGQTAGKVIIKTDSKLVVEQVKKRWKCKKPHLKPLCVMAQELIAEVDADIIWIPREENKRADELSHEWENMSEVIDFQAYVKKREEKNIITGIEFVNSKPHEGICPFCQLANLGRIYGFWNTNTHSPWG